MISSENAERYKWGEVCDGWHLLQRADVSVIQERVPADVHFLVVSVPYTHGDRINSAPAAVPGSEEA
jgi:hypothetical protein